MTPDYDIHRFADLHERISRFAEVAGELVLELGLEKTGGRGPKAEPASDRVIRDYVRRRILSPTLKGLDSDERGYYGFQHLVEFLAARVLLNDGWPLEKIAERHRHATSRELLTLIPGQVSENDAQALARSFRSPSLASKNRLPLFGSPAPAKQKAPAFEGDNLGQTTSSVSASRRRAELPLLMRQLTGVDAPPRIRKIVTIEIGTELTLLIDQQRAQNLSFDEADAIGRAVTAALIDFPNLARGKDPEQCPSN